MNPLVIRLIAAAVTLVAVASFGYWRGYESQADTVTELKVQMKAADAAADIELKQVNVQVQERQKLLDTVGVQIKQMEGERNAAHADADNLRADLAAARKRLSVSIAPGSCRPTGQGATAGSPAVGDGPAVTAELDPTVAARLVELTDTGDQAIRRLNACIASYRAAQDAIR